MLPLFPTQYYGEIQEEGIDFTTNGYETKLDDSSNESIHNIDKYQRAYYRIGMKKYFIHMKNDDFDDAILGW